MEREGCSCKNICIVEEIFGQVPSENTDETSSDDAKSVGTIEVKSYKMSNEHGMEVVVISWGASIVSIKCLDKYGEPADIVFGFDNLDGYLNPRLSQMMGCIVGRCARDLERRPSADNSSEQHQGCIENSTNDETNNVDAYSDEQTNRCCLGRRVWEAYVEDDCRVVMSYLSPDGEDGYPGALLTTIKFELTRYNSLQIGMRAVSSKPTAVNLSHSSVFNLAGHAAGPAELRTHEISFNCERWIQRTGDDDVIIRRVGGLSGVMDLRMPQLLGQVIDKLSAEKLHHLYLSITRRSASLQPKMSFVSRISHPKTGRFLEVYSDQPVVEFNTGGQLLQSSLQPQAAIGSKECLTNLTDCECHSQSSNSLVITAQDNDVRMLPLEFLPGKCGAEYKRFGGFSLLPQNYLTAIKKLQPLFPSATLRPGQIYYHDLVYKFGVELDSYCVS